MVLKVVTGKILETLKLSWRAAVFSCAILGRGRAPWSVPEAETMDELSKIINYLVDNLRACMLAELKG